ncbi:MAG: lysylphosphatidylglycerol synthase transmembrane domain-containing protein [Chitinispirillaceae bacterium]
MKFGKLIQIVIGLLIMGAALYIFLKGTNPETLLRQLSSINPLRLVTGGFLGVLSLYFRAKRWHYILPDKTDTRKTNLFPFVSIGFMVNNLVPARIGEAVRAFLLWTRNGYSATTSIGSLIVERSIDMAFYGSFFVIPALFLPRLSTLRPVAWIIGAAILGFILMLTLYRLFTSRVKRLGKTVINRAPDRFRPKLLEMGSEIASTLDWLFSVKRSSAIFLYTVLTSICYPMIMLVLIEPAADFGIISALFIQAAASVGSAIPLSPGYVGTLHAVMLQGLSYLGIESDRARAIAILYHAINYIPVTLIGIWYFFRVKLSLDDIREAKERLQETTS